MEKLKVAVVGVGSIAQIVHLPILKKLEDVEVAAICDVDESKVHAIIKKFDIPRWYSQIDDLISEEDLDAIHICTNNLYHYPMSYLALNNGINIFVEKPIALNAADAEKIHQLAKEKNLTAMIGMQNRFRDEVIMLKKFIDNDELGEVFYVKAGWLKKWSRGFLQNWELKKDYAGGGVLIDLGSQLVDLALFLNNKPPIKSVRLYDYCTHPRCEVEDAALAVIETTNHLTITVEISWRMHLEKDMIYTHIFGKKGAAYLNPLRINKELHGNLVNVTPIIANSNADSYIHSYENEIRHFTRVVRGEEENLSSTEDALYVMRIIDALYESGKAGKEINL